jgi:hypothetical protein
MTNLPPEDDQEQISIRKHSYSQKVKFGGNVNQVGRDYTVSRKHTISFWLVLFLTILQFVLAGIVWFRSQKVAPSYPSRNPPTPVVPIQK